MFTSGSKILDAGTTFVPGLVEITGAERSGKTSLLRSIVEANNGVLLNAASKVSDNAHFSYELLTSLLSSDAYGVIGVDDTPFLTQGSVPETIQYISRKALLNDKLLVLVNQYRRGIGAPDSIQSIREHVYLTIRMHPKACEYNIFQSLAEIGDTRFSLYFSGGQIDLAWDAAVSDLRQGVVVKRGSNYYRGDEMVAKGLESLVQCYRDLSV